MAERTEPVLHRQRDLAAAPPVPTNAVGIGESFTDPLWRITVRPSPVEVDLLRTEPLRRLHFVAHGGASAVSTLQSYSRLEHTLGVFALAAHFRPEDEALRVAALLHDIGHLPLSHTVEGIAGLDHHAIGMRLLRTAPVGPVLDAHGVDLADVLAALAGPSASPLRNGEGLLNLDHLDSFVRSGRDAARLDTDPPALLDRLELHGAAVSADHATAETLIGLVGAEARLHTSWDNVGPVSVVRRLARRLIEGGAVAPGRLARMTDAQLWSAFESLEATRGEAALLHYEPHRLKVAVGDGAGPPAAWGFALRKIYRSAPLVGGAPLGAAAPGLAAALEELTALPTVFRVWWE
jgi:hypothetical protein